MTIIFPIDFTRYFCVITVSVVLLGQSFHTLLCPEDEFSWKKREIVFSCGSLSYHCGISVHGSEVEFCASPMFMEKGFCPLFDITDAQNIVVQECRHKGCPQEGYVTNTLYKYPSCLNISVENTTSMFRPINTYSTKPVVTNSNNVSVFTTEYSDKVYHAAKYGTSKSTYSIPMNAASGYKIPYVLVICGCTVFLLILLTIPVLAYALHINRRAMENKGAERITHPHVINMDETAGDGLYAEIHGGNSVVFENHNNQYGGDDDVNEDDDDCGPYSHLESNRIIILQ